MGKAKPVKRGDLIGGKYRVERVVGEGGMGVVVAARHAELGQRVALKLLHEQGPTDAEATARFLREARAVVQLRSDHVAKVHDVGRTKAGQPFIVMELLTGEDLGVVLARGALPVAAAVDAVLQACEAVAEAHARGVVHRDLKPRNLFLVRRANGEPIVKVLDFGLAKEGGAGADRALTHTTAVMGSPQYMSPEQMRASRDVDARTDIWSLGICLYELLTGVTPFDAPALPEVCALVMTAEPRPIRELRADVPDALWQVIRACLAKDPAQRYGTVLDLTRALEPFAVAPGAVGRVAAVVRSVESHVSEHPPPSLRESDTRTEAAFDSGRERSTAKSWWLVVAGAVLVVVVGGVAGYTQATRARQGASATSASPELSVLPAATTRDAIPSAGVAATDAPPPAGSGLPPLAPPSASARSAPRPRLPGPALPTAAKSGAPHVPPPKPVDSRDCPSCKP